MSIEDEWDEANAAFRRRSSKIVVTRLGFSGFDIRDNGTPYDGPELALQAALRHMEDHDHDILGVQILRSTRTDERYEAFVISKVKET